MSNQKLKRLQAKLNKAADLAEKKPPPKLLPPSTPGAASFPFAPGAPREKL